MAIQLAATNKFTLGSNYNPWTETNLINFILTTYNIWPDVIRFLPQASMKSYYFNIQKIIDNLYSKDYWETFLNNQNLDSKLKKWAGDIITGIPGSLETLHYKNKTVWDSWNGEIDNVEKLCNESAIYEDSYAYGWDDEIGSVPVDDWMRDALENEAISKKITKCEDKDGNKVYLRHDFSRIILLDYNKLKYIEGVSDIISRNFVLLFVYDADTVIPEIYYNATNPIENLIVDGFCNAFKGAIVKKWYESKATVSFVVQTPAGFSTKEMEIKDVIKTEKSLFMNTNDDFKEVHKNTLEFLQSNESGLIIFRGEPGTGKTSYIKYLTTLLNENKDSKKIIFISASIMNNLSDPAFISFLSDCKDSIIILEDCEQLLADRNTGASIGFINSGLMNLLNMTDGILGSAFKFKFICTFNAELDKVDQALLRKGRCKVNYEFKKLTVDKINKLIDEGIVKNPWNDSKEIPLSVANLYNQEDKDFTEIKKQKVGFLA